MLALITKLRAPYAAKLSEKLAVTEGLLYRRGNFNGTLDEVILAALMAGTECEIAFSPGFRFGTSVLPNEAVTVEDVMNATAITYPYVMVNELTGEAIKTLLEDICDNLFNPDPYYQQGGDMVRTAGLRYTCRPNAPMGKRIDNLILGGKPLDASRRYKVASWAPVAEGASGKADMGYRHSVPAFAEGHQGAAGESAVARWRRLRSGVPETKKPSRGGLFVRNVDQAFAGSSNISLCTVRVYLRHSAGTYLYWPAAGVEQAHATTAPAAPGAVGVSVSVTAPALAAVTTVMRPVAAVQAIEATFPTGAVMGVTPKHASAGITPPLLEMFSLTVVFAAPATVKPSVTRARIV